MTLDSIPEAMTSAVHNWHHTATIPLTLRLGATAEGSKGAAQSLAAFLGIDRGICAILAKNVPGFWKCPGRLWSFFSDFGISRNLLKVFDVLLLELNKIGSD